MNEISQIERYWEADDPWKLTSAQKRNLGQISRFRKIYGGYLGIRKEKTIKDE
jgi:hypothetical protein